MALGARPEQGEGIVTGDVVNTASRLQGAAPVDGIAVSEQTYRQTERVFDYEQLEPVQVKGKTEPLVALAAARRPGPLRHGRDPHAHDAARRSRAGEDAADRDARPRAAAALLPAGDDRRRAGRRQEPPLRRAASATSRSATGLSAGGRAAAFPTATGSPSGRSARS